MQNITLPNLGVEDVEVVEILVKKNDFIKKDQVLLIVESNKTTIEILSDTDGTISEILIKIGDLLNFNDNLFKLKDNNNINNTYKVILSTNNNIKIYINKILIKINDIISINDELININLNNNNYILKSNFNGKILNILFKEKEILSNYELFLIDYKNIILKNSLINEEKKIIYLQYIDTTEDLKLKNFVKTSPSIRKLLKKVKLDLNDIKNEFKYTNRITKENIYDYLIKNFNNTNDKYKLDNNKFKHSNINENLNEDKIINKIKITNLSKTLNKKLCYSYTNVPHVTQHDYIDITSLENFRQFQNKNKFSDKDYKISLLSFIIKSIYFALKKYPFFNSSISDDNNFLIIKKYINIGFAVDTVHGLFVPVIKELDKKNIKEISKEIKILSIKAKNNKLLLNDTNEGTFTISSLGSIGNCEFFTPIINYPEVSILGISKFKMSPIWKDNKFVPKLMLPISLSYDHRVINGADSIKFINYIKIFLEDYREFLLI